MLHCFEYDVIMCYVGELYQGGLEALLYWEQDVHVRSTLKRYFGGCIYSLQDWSLASVTI